LIGTGRAQPKPKRKMARVPIGSMAQRIEIQASQQPGRGVAETLGDITVRDLVQGNRQQCRNQHDRDF